MTNIGELTTIFTPPASCADFAGYYKVFSEQESSSGRVYHDMQGPTESECFPDNYNATRGNYYMPGVCPSGYTAACSSSDGIQSETTTVTCCPTTMDYSCLSSWFPTLICGFELTRPGNLDPLTELYNGEVVVTSSSMLSGVINARGIEIRFETELSFTTSSSESSSSDITSSTSTEPESSPSLPTSSPTTEPTPTPDSESSDQGLDTGAIVGIAVGTAVAGILIGIALVCLFMRRRKTRQQAGGMIAGTQGRPTPELDSAAAKSLGVSEGMGHGAAYSPPPAGYWQPQSEMTSGYNMQQRPEELDGGAPYNTYPRHGGYGGGTQGRG